MAIRILVADDHGVVRAGLRALLNVEGDLEVVGEAESGQEVLARAQALRPDVVLLDISMPGLDGLQALRQLHELSPRPRVLVLTVHEDEGLLRESIRAGAAGYIVKRAVATELVDAIRAVCRGQVYIHPAMTHALLPETRRQGGLPPGQLTPRERQVLQLIAQGYTNRQIAAEWTISVRTVEGHRASLMAKLDLHSRVELVRYCLEHGLLPAEPHRPVERPSD